MTKTFKTQRLAAEATKEVTTMVVIGVAVLLVLMSASSVEWLTPISATLRLTGVCLIIAAGLFRQRKQVTVRERQFLPHMMWLCVAYLSYAIISMLSHNLMFQFLTRGTYLVLIMATISTLIIRFTLREIVIGLAASLSALILAGFYLAAVNPELAVEQGRVRGLLENANYFGFIGAILVAVGSRFFRGKLLFAGCLALGWGAVIGSQSRGAALLAAVVLMGMAANRVPRIRTLFAVLTVAIVPILIASPQDLIGRGLLRLNNSRADGLGVALRSIEGSAWTGAGYLQEQWGIAGTPLAALAQGGILGLLSMVVIFLIILGASARVGKNALTFAVAVVLYGLIESWLVAFTGPLTFVILVAWIAFIRYDAMHSDQLLPDGKGSNRTNSGWHPRHVSNMTIRT